MPLLGPKNSGPESRPIQYRIKKDVRPYSGRLLTPDYEEDDRVGGHINGVPYVRWYARAELDRVR